MVSDIRAGLPGGAVWCTAFSAGVTVNTNRLLKKLHTTRDNLRPLYYWVGEQLISGTLTTYSTLLAPCSSTLLCCCVTICIGRSCYYRGKTIERQYINLNESNTSDKPLLDFLDTHFIFCTGGVFESKPHPTALYSISKVAKTIQQIIFNTHRKKSKGSVGGLSAHF